jgi:wyosine [tRNA(Phe)-imidazoG37] synthetase (radical SAM superfamily)
MKIVYGPISSWRLGKSLGIDLICSNKKICSFNCIYCQLTRYGTCTTKRDNFISLDNLKIDLQYALKNTTPDVITLSGTGEPTLAKNIDKVISIVKNITEIPIAILTNSTLLYLNDVQNILSKIDIIVAKLDASNSKLFNKINKPAEGINFRKTVDGIKSMRDIFDGKFNLQIMFMEENKDYANDIANIARDMHPDEIQINTPLRPCMINSLSKKDIIEIQNYFNDFKKVINVYDSKRPKVKPLDLNEIYLRKRPVP